MTLDTIRRWLRPWLLWRERRNFAPWDDRLARTIPEYADALKLEKLALQKGHTQGVNRARQMKREALHRALMAKRRVRVKAPGVRVRA